MSETRFRFMLIYPDSWALTRPGNVETALPPDAAISRMRPSLAAPGVRFGTFWWCAPITSNRDTAERADQAFLRLCHIDWPPLARTRANAW
jgi:hypothetical protein